MRPLGSPILVDRGFVASTDVQVDLLAGLGICIQIWSEIVEECTCQPYSPVGLIPRGP